MNKSYQTDRLILKTLSSDAASMVLTFYQENKSAFEPWEPLRSNTFYTLAYHTACLTAEHTQMQEGKLLRFWIFLKDYPDEIIGSLCFQRIAREPYYSCSLGYKFATKHQHKGYAFESTQSAIHLIFRDYQMHRIEAHTMPENIASQQLLERLSFDYEGISRGFALINGEWKDHKQYSLLNPYHLS
jgi:ribosomal-protein-alanine N-acetyltransferase